MINGSCEITFARRRREKLDGRELRSEYGKMQFETKDVAQQLGHK